MYLHRDTKEDIPNTFDPETSNKFFAVVEVIWIISKGWIKREDIPADVLKRVDDEIAFVKNRIELHTKNHKNGNDEKNFPSKCPECLSEIEFLQYQYELRKKDIPREFVNPAYATEKLSIWDIVQLLRHGAVDFSLMPKEIKEKVDAELHRRGKIWKNTMSRSQHSEIVNQENR